MKCCLLMNAASKSNSTILLKIYEKCPHDAHSCSTCVRILELNEGAPGKINNARKNDRRGCLYLSKFG